MCAGIFVGAKSFKDELTRNQDLLVWYFDQKSDYYLFFLKNQWQEAA